MKTVEIHRLADREQLEQFRLLSVRGVEAFLAKETQGVSSEAPLARKEFVRAESLGCAQLALLLDQSDADAGRWFSVAVRYAEKVLSSSPTALLGGARMSFADFSRSFFTLWAFGEETPLAEAARIPERDYKSPGLVVPEEGFALMEAQKQLALRNYPAAREMLTRLRPALNARQKAYVGAIDGVFAGDREAVEAGLLADIKLHKKLAAKTPGDMDGLVCYTSLMVCRLALWHGIVIDDQNYLPLRFMPGHPQNVGRGSGSPETGA